MRMPARMARPRTLSRATWSAMGVRKRRGVGVSTHGLSTDWLSSKNTRRGQPWPSGVVHASRASAETPIHATCVHTETHMAPAHGHQVALHCYECRCQCRGCRGSLISDGHVYNDDEDSRSKASVSTAIAICRIDVPALQQCIAIISSTNSPLYLRSFGPNDGKEAGLRYQFIAHSALDSIEERSESARVCVR